MVILLIYTSLIAVIVLSLITGLITTIIEKRDLRAQRTKVFKAIKESEEKDAAQQIVEVPMIKQSSNVLNITQEIEVLDFEEEQQTSFLKKCDQEVL